MFHRRRRLLAGSAAVALLAVVTLVGSAVAEELNPEADLSISKTVSTDTAAPGDTLVYTLTVSNAGPFAAVAVHAVDTLPAGVAFVSAPGCTHAGGVVDCLAGTSGIMFPDDVSTFEITVEVGGSATGTLTNVAIVENREDPETGPIDPDPTNNDDAASTTIVTTPQPGAIGDFVWNDVDGDGVQDPGEPGIQGVTVVAVGPAGTFTATTDASGSYLIDELSPGDYTVEVAPETVPSGLVATTAATVEPSLSEGESFLDADFGFVSGLVDLIDLELTKSVDPAVVSVGATARFTIVLTNRGPADATGVVVSDVLPAGLDFVSSSAEFGAYEPSTGAWMVGDVESGATVTLEISVVPNDAGSFTNTAEVTSAAEPDVDSVPGDGAGDDFDSAVIDVVQVAASAQIGDTVWLDSDADGVQDPGEPGIAGVTVRLVPASGPAEVMVTGADGKYLFAGLDAGGYTVRVDTTTVADDLGLTTVGEFTVTLADDGSFLDADFGFAEILPATGFGSAAQIALGLMLVLLGGVIVSSTRRV